MSKEMITYKVLWVDDDWSIVQPYQLIAEDYGLELIHRDNWEEAQTYLNDNFDEISAIILDANCKISKYNLEKETFIPSVLPSMLQLFGKKQRMISWYLLSAGTMSHFDFIIQSAQPHHQKEWGNMLYLKDLEDENPQSSAKLFKTIQRVVKDRAFNTVLFKHKDVFKYIGEDKLIDNRARQYLLRMLSSLYYPEENIKFQFEGNPLRKVLEYLFRAANKKGLLPDECLDGGDNINLLESNKFMSGLNTRYSKLRYGNPGKDINGKTTENGRGGDSIFPEHIGYMSQAIIQYTSADSHTKENDPYTIDSDNKEMFFGFVLQLCHIIKYFGEFVEKHPNIKENKKMIRKVDEPTKESQPTYKQPIPSVKRKEPTKDELTGTKQTVLNGDRFKYCGYCKLSPEIAKTVLISQSITIKALEDNTGEDRKKYPYIVTEISTD